MSLVPRNNVLVLASLQDQGQNPASQVPIKILPEKGIISPHLCTALRGGWEGKKGRG